MRRHPGELVDCVPASNTHRGCQEDDGRECQGVAVGDGRILETLPPPCITSQTTAAPAASRPIRLSHERARRLKAPRDRRRRRSAQNNAVAVTMICGRIARKLTCGKRHRSLPHLYLRSSGSQVAGVPRYRR